jgi:AcrR family transcriptional regulator
MALRHAKNMSLETRPPRAPTAAAGGLCRLIEDGVYISEAYVEPAELPPRPDAPPPSSFEHVLRWAPSPDKSAPSSARGRRTWNAVRKAAIRVFSQHGLANTTVLDIAQEAGVSSGTVYRYFVDKEDIFRSLQALVEEEIISESHLPMDRGRIHVREQFVAYLHIYRRHLGLFRAWLDLIHSGPHPADAWFKMRETFQDRAARILSYGRRHGIIHDSVRIPITAELYVMAHEGPTYCHLVLDWNQGIDDAEIADAVTGLFSEGLA